MMKWEEEYKKKLISADEAAAKIKSGDYVAFTAGREAHSIGLALAARLGDLKDVRVLAPSPGHDFGWYDEGWQDAFSVVTMFPTPTCQEAIDAGRIDMDIQGLIPFEIPPGGRNPDVVLTEVSAPDRNGFCSFGASCWNKKDQIRKSKLAIAEINDRLIKPCGADNFIHVDEIDFFVEHKTTGAAPGMGTLSGRAPKEPEPYLKNICGYVSEIIKDGDTIQIGVGRTTEPLVRLGLFNNKKDIGFHSEATPPGIIPLVQSGIVNGKRKTLNPETVVVTTIGGGTKQEMEWVDNNPMFRLVDVRYLEDVRVIAAHDNMVALNNCLMVDLTGQIVADSLGRRIMSAAGGQIAFVVGATLSKGGRAITVLPATAVGGSVSRIVSTLPLGTAVTIQRNLADHIVTEFGVARLRGKSVKQRVEELINIAHPDFRSELRKEAKKIL
jgi:4-hydroxybutyrate CoA-transferase